ncbi:uncharacterized protein LOC112594380 [Melanaphis sacchari]|uniref:uncharacterized protein LOC112594380 n=1 Tax=Melanaphis sacchari TaxID=742174 RepID=UPI000DC157EE|nr:uncharacterized protein LOC112594380 [Melanaphis sacchari]
MILYFLFFYLLGESVASSCSNQSTSSNFSNKVMCYFKGHMDEIDITLIDLDPKKLPSECEVIIYSRFKINELSIIDVDEELLKNVTDTNKPVIVRLFRTNFYDDWSKVLSSNGNSKEAKILCDFAKKNKIKGYLIKSIAPHETTGYFAFNENIGKYIIPYIKQLKECNLIIGVTINTAPSLIQNLCVYNYDELNGIVDFYEVDTYFMNKCNPNLYNGRTPITKSEHGPNYLYGMEEVASYIKKSKISQDKLAFAVELYPANNNSTYFSSYTQVCTGQFDNSSWCVQTSRNLYDKGKFVRKLNGGILIEYLEFDDINNDCGCNSTFNGFKNIIGGFKSGQLSPCQNFDVQSTSYTLK